MSVTQNISTINLALKKSAATWARKVSDITLVAVSKYQPAEKVQEAILAGHTVFGENKVQEAEEKWPELLKNHKGIELHLIGPLQTNKVKKALELFDVVETIDRSKLVDEIARQLPKHTKPIRFFVQVNVGEEEQKNGALPEEVPKLIAYCKEKNVPIEGLMCIPPHDEPPAPYFALLNKLAANHGIKKLSMGMSADFEEAVSLGATHIRVGTAIFGERK